MNRSILILPVLFILLVGIQSAAFVVNETEQVIITQFGEPIGRQIDTPGLKFKMPFLQTAHRFEKRYLEWDGDPNQLPTRDKRFIWVDSYARWRITDPLLYFQRLRDERGAKTRLDDILDGETRNAIANHDLLEVIRTSNREIDPALLLHSMAAEDEFVTLEKIESGRDGIRDEILKSAAARVSDLGIEVLDYQFKRINYVDEVRRKVYERMITERMRIADRYRSEGEGEASRIRGERARDLKQIQSEAYREAEGIVGQADSLATRIYAGAYDRSPSTRDFYGFLKTMESYQSTVDGDTWMLMSTDGEFYENLTTSR